MVFWFLVMTGQALLMSPKGRNASRDGPVKLWEGSFFIICNTITLWNNHLIRVNMHIKRVDYLYDSINRSLVSAYHQASLCKHTCASFACE